MPSIAERRLEFLRKLQRLLTEGDFSSTYKFALLQALADLSVERSHLEDPLTLTVDEIAGKFVEYYWRQGVPYGELGVIRQNNSRQATVLSRLVQERETRDGDLNSLRHDVKAWRRLIRSIGSTVRTMPIAHLQNIEGGRDEFLYRSSDVQIDRLRLLPGVADALREFHPLVVELVRAAWVDRVRRFASNRELLGSIADLRDFLFGIDRRSLERVRGILRDVQGSRCFYCKRESARGDADHFIAWRRYPVDLAHNFVYACGRCNRAKRDFLASVDHLSRWHDVHVVRGSTLTQLFDDAGLAHDRARSEYVARWAYEQAEATGAHGWVAGDRFSVIGSRWRTAFGSELRAAERSADYRTDAPDY